MSADLWLIGGGIVLGWAMLRTLGGQRQHQMAELDVELQALAQAAAAAADRPADPPAAPGPKGRP